MESTMTATQPPAPAAARRIGAEERRVMIASSVGALFECDRVRDLLTTSVPRANPPPPVEESRPTPDAPGFS
jgi:hypothetical protein